MFALTVLYFFIVVLLGIPVIWFILECLVGLLPTRKHTPGDQSSHITTGIIIPAHNEERIIEETLDNVCAQIKENDKVVVIADNCSDKTAEIARKYPVTVLERFHDTERGKGYALDYGMKYFAENAPDQIVIMDADCLLADNSLSQLKHECAVFNRPIQAKYLMLNKEDAGISAKILEFAFLVKNFIRMRGLKNMGLPSQLTGTGMCFPYDTLKDAALASGEIVEDMKLGIDLAIDGKPPLFSEHAYVYSYFPSQDTDQGTQKERWEHGHLGLIQAMSPSLLNAAISKGKPTLFGVLFDLLIPPLSLLIILNCLALFASFIISLFAGSLYYSYLPALYLGGITACVVLLWVLYGRNILSPSEMLSLPLFVLKKIGSYTKFISNRETKWTKTNRD